MLSGTGWRERSTGVTRSLFCSARAAAPTAHSPMIGHAAVRRANPVIRSPSGAADCTGVSDQVEGASLAVAEQPADADAAQAAEDAAFVLAAAGAGGVGEHAARKARERQRLEPDFAGAGDRRDE